MTEKKMKIVGKRQRNARPSAEDQNAFFRLLETMRPTPHVVPRGLYRFKTFEKAQEWMRTEMARTMRRSIRGHRPSRT